MHGDFQRNNSHVSLAASFHWVGKKIHASAEEEQIRGKVSILFHSELYFEIIF